MREITDMNKIIPKKKFEHLNCSLSMPSTAHTYSVIAEFMKVWFLEKMPEDLFNVIHLEGKHIFDDFRGLSATELIKKESPKLAIVPKFNLEYNRNGLDVNQMGVDMLMKQGRIERSIIRDYSTNSFIGTNMELLESEFTFILQLESKAQQIDIYKYMNMVFSVGSVLDVNIDLDYHLPYNMMVQFARDNGFKVKNNKILDSMRFIKYINQKSRLPVMFKYRTINGHMEYFIRFNDIDVHLDITDPLSVDDGQSKGMMHRNFMLEMNVKVKVPSPKFFMYYSTNKHEFIRGVDTITPDDNSTIYPIYTIELSKVPKVNERGWNQYLTTEYQDSNTKEYISIEFEDMFNEGSDIRQVIDISKESGISPDNFIEFKIYNMENHDLPHTVDWDDIIVKYGILVEGEISFISIYIDTDYVFGKLKDLENLHNSRLKETTYTK